MFHFFDIRHDFTPYQEHCSLISSLFLLCFQLLCEMMKSDGDCCYWRLNCIILKISLMPSSIEFHVFCHSESLEKFCNRFIDSSNLVRFLCFCYFRELKSLTKNGKSHYTRKRGEFNFADVDKNNKTKMFRFPCFLFVCFSMILRVRV